MFCFIQLLQTPWTHPLPEMGIYTFASKYQPTQHGNPIQKICRGCAAFLHLSSQGDVPGIVAGTCPAVSRAADET